MATILYGNFTATAKLLAQMLTAAGLRTVASEWGRGRAALRAAAGYDDGLLINWGVKLTQREQTRMADTGMLNRLAGMDKRTQMTMLHGAGVTIPPTYGIGHGIPDGVRRIRKHIQSSGGQGVRVLGDNEPDAVDADHIVQALVDKRAEFRVHVWRGKVLCTTRKYPDGNAPNQHIWNHGNGYVQKTVTKMGDLMDDTLAHVATSAVTALGYDFGAVDIAMAKDGTMYVLEVNSAPSLIEERAALYVAEIVATTAQNQHA